MLIDVFHVIGVLLSVRCIWFVACLFAVNRDKDHSVTMYIQSYSHCQITQLAA